MLLAVVVFCVVATPWSLGQRVHEQMTPKQVAETFQATHDSVPEYEVVQFHVPRQNERPLGELRRVEAPLFGNDVKLWLKPAEGVLAGRDTPVFIAKKDRQTPNVTYQLVPDAMLNLGLILEDPFEKATLLARIDARGKYSFNGFIGRRNIHVRSLPNSISNDLLRNRSSHISKLSKNSKSAYHVVFKRSVFTAPAKPIGKSKLDIWRKKGFQGGFKTIASPIIPEVIYPECMVVVDYRLFKLFDHNVENVLMYILTFWNGVDLLYRAIDQPKFRFNIPRIVIAAEDEATPYLSQHMYSPTRIAGYPANNAAKHYFYSIKKIFPTTSYDAIVIMTGIRLANSDGRGHLLGLAAEGGICGVNHRAELVKSVVLAHDDGAFYGVGTVAHEFGHLLGSAHDTKAGCDPSHGYIMAPTSIKTKNSHDFSRCTINAIENLLTHNGGFCLFNEPKVTFPLPREHLPGMMASRDRQCEMMGHGPSCYNPSKKHRCTAVYCYHKRKPKDCYVYRLRTPLDGAFCDKGKVCLHGNCVSL